MKSFITDFAADESGATAIEYGLLAALISVVIIAGASLLGTNINTLFNDIAKCIADPKSADCKWKAATTTPTTP
ncbi:MAG: Flp family type IVb pilin [Pseudomonadota bacterium]